MSVFLGIDTSNYTTSCAAYSENEAVQEKMLLPVKPGECGFAKATRYSITHSSFQGLWKS